MSEISALTKETQSISSLRWPCENPARCLNELGSMPSPDTKFAESLILEFTTSRTVRNKCLLYRLPNYDIFVITGQMA